LRQSLSQVSKSFFQVFGMCPRLMHVAPPPPPPPPSVLQQLSGSQPGPEPLHGTHGRCGRRKQRDGGGNSLSVWRGA
jgi:hypothetical protein